MYCHFTVIWGPTKIMWATHRLRTTGFTTILKTVGKSRVGSHLSRLTANAQSSNQPTVETKQKADDKKHHQHAPLTKHRNASITSYILYYINSSQ